MLEKQPNVRVLMTRDEDVFHPAGRPGQQGAKTNADLFVSIHADAFIKAGRPWQFGICAVGQGGIQHGCQMAGQQGESTDLIGGVKLNVRDPIWRTRCWT